MSPTSTTTVTADVASLPQSVSTSIHFIDPPEGEKRLWQNINSDHTGKRPRNWEQAVHTVSVENWRGNPDIALDTTGFQVVSDKPTKHIKDGEVDVQNYYDESIKFIKEVTGASRVELFDHSQSCLHVLTLLF
jgi:hypothetical protein